MHEQGGRPRRAESSCNLASDQAALAHTGDDHSSCAGMEEFDASIECSRQWSRNTIGEILQGLSLYADNIFSNAVHGKRMVAGNSS